MNISTLSGQINMAFSKPIKLMSVSYVVYAGLKGVRQQTPRAAVLRRRERRPYSRGAVNNKLGPAAREAFSGPGSDGSGQRDDVPKIKPQKIHVWCSTSFHSLRSGLS